MTGEANRPPEPDDAGCVDDSDAVKAADATSEGDQEPGYEEIEVGGDRS